jgi:hypothetical protein
LEILDAVGCGKAGPRFRHRVRPVPDANLARARVVIFIATGDFSQIVRCFSRRGSPPPNDPKEGLSFAGTFAGVFGWRFVRALGSVFEGILHEDGDSPVRGILGSAGFAQMLVSVTPHLRHLVGAQAIFLH